MAYYRYDKGQRFKGLDLMQDHNHRVLSVIKTYRIGTNSEFMLHSYGTTET